MSDATVQLLTTLLTTIGVLGAAALSAWAVAKNKPSKSALLAEKVATCERELRLVIDYVHDLRGDVVDLGGTPRDWPKELTTR